MSCILDGDLFEESCLWVHGGFPELLGVHLTQTFVSLSVDVLVFHAFAILVDKGLALLFCIAVLAHLVLERTFVQWWSGDIEVSFLDNLWHEAIEQCHNQGVDV